MNGTRYQTLRFDQRQQKATDFTEQLDARLNGLAADGWTVRDTFVNGEGILHVIICK